MAPISLEEFLVAKPQTAGRTRGPKPNLVGKFALFVGIGGIMLWSCRRRRHHHQLDLAFQVCLFANLSTFILGLLLIYVSMVDPPESTTTRNGKITMWVTLFMSAVILALGSYLLVFGNLWVPLD